MNQIPINPEILNNARDITCVCGSSVFDVAFTFKFISSIISPDGQATVVPNQIFICRKCGELLSIESTEEERAGVILKDNVIQADKPVELKEGKKKSASQPKDKDNTGSGGGNGTPKGANMGIVSAQDN